MVKEELNIKATIEFEIDLLFSVVSLFGIISINVVSILYSRKEKIYALNRKSSRLIFVFVALLSLLASLLYSENSKYLNFAWTISLLVLTTFTIIWGASQFFVPLTIQEMKSSNNQSNSSLSTFVNAITIIIIGLELLIVFGSAFDGSYLNCMLFASGSIQKATQVFIYHYKLRHLKAITDRMYGASWYYKLIALLNFILWNESIEVTTDDQTK